MSNVVFKSEQACLSVSSEHLFHHGVVTGDETQNYRNYEFNEGEERNLLTLTKDEDIEAMRAYAATTNNRIVELVNGEDPVEHVEGIVFEASTPHFRLTPAEYKHVTPAEGKTFAFDVGAKRNQYITEDEEEIATLRSYISQNMNTGIVEVG